MENSLSSDEIINRESSKKKFIYTLLSLISIVLLIIIFFFYLGLKNSEEDGPDLTILEVVSGQRENPEFNYPVLKIQNIGNKIFNSSLSFSIVNSNGEIEWNQEKLIINPEERVFINGPGFTAYESEEVKFILDKNNQTEDLNFENNIYILKIE
jgi:hypothetical protein